MINLSQIINDKTFIISDTHLGHARMLQFESIRNNFLIDYTSNTEVIDKCNKILSLLNEIPEEDHRSHTEINELCRFLIPYHDEMVIEKWNSIVGKKDTVIHLGDFAFRDIEKNTESLNGRKILMRGNHDLKSAKHYINCGWKEVIEAIKININDFLFEMTPNLGKHWNGFLTNIFEYNILFSHYPIYNNDEWDVKKYGTLTDTLEKVYEGYGGNINIHGHSHSHKSLYDNAINVSAECIDITPIRIGKLLEKNGY